MGISSALGSSALAPSGFGFRNLLINGAMQVAQRGTSTASITAGGYYTADRFHLSIGSFGTWTQSVENDAPTGSGFRKSLKMLCTTAAASPAAGANLTPQYRLEGQNLQQFLKGTQSAQQFSLSFWVKSNVTGTYIVELDDQDNSRSVSASYTVNASATWEKKIIVLPADTTGAFDNDNAYSLGVNFWLGAGSNFMSGTLATSWQARTTANRVVGQVNLAAATNNYWQITGVQLEANPTASTFEHRPIGVELALCQRYYEKTYAIDTKPATATTVGMYLASITSHSDQTTPFTVRFSVTKRNDTYSIAGYNPAGGGTWYYQRNGVGETSATFNVVYKSSGSFVGYLGSGAAWVPVLVYGHWVADAEL
jgi:hypothetical protein